MSLLLVALALAAAPESPPAGESAPITVTSDRLSDAEISRQANDYVRSILTTQPSYDQYARWTVPVCIKVTGIADDYAAIVEARMRAAATAAGIALARPGCSTNLSVVFSEDARNTTAIITRKKPKQIARLNGIETRTLLEAPLPVRWWHVLQPGDGNSVGGGIESNALGGAQAGGGNAAIAAGRAESDAVTTNSYSSSLIDTNFAIGATSAVAVVDIPLATGKPLTAVADYVAMVTLAPARLPPASPAANSILSLFSPDSNVIALSPWDKAFLASLQKMTLNRNARWQRGQIVTRIAADIKEGAP